MLGGHGQSCEDAKLDQDINNNKQIEHRSYTLESTADPPKTYMGFQVR